MRAFVVFGLFLMASASAPASETITYQYDALGRLVQVTRSGSVNNGAAAAYTYDPANNRTNVTTTAPGGGGMALKQPAAKDQAGQTAGAANAAPRK
jgi:YD repeat-containing protein